MTSGDVGDAPVLPDLLDQISADRDIASVTAPLSRIAGKPLPAARQHMLACVGGGQRTAPMTPEIAMKPSLSKNAKPSKTGTAGAVARNEAFWVSK